MLFSTLFVVSSSAALYVDYHKGSFICALSQSNIYRLFLVPSRLIWLASLPIFWQAFRLRYREEELISSISIEIVPNNKSY